MSMSVSASAPVPAAAAVATRLTGAQKAAILMVILGEETSGALLRELDEEEVQYIGRGIAGIPVITSEIAEEVLAEFYEMIVAQDYILKGGLEYARKVLESAFGADRAKRLLDRLSLSLSTDSAHFDALQRADPQQLATFIHNEHPQTVALILSHVGGSQAARLLRSLPPETRTEVSVRMANLDQISPDVISRISTIIGQKLKSIGELSRQDCGGVRAVAEIFNRLEQDESKEILENIETSNPALVETIRHLMFVFEDLLKVDSTGMRELLARVDRKVLTIALKGTSEKLKNHFLQVMSQRGAEMLLEDMEALGAIKMREVEAAQQQIVAAVRLLESEGVINLKDSGAEQYVS
ncbi:MAG TPA: flagellar motor switch protein FliG [Bryobacteraceae bacterium]|nr:flagellar motor switch protein FliG [Bryobacteraceae bacterium]